MGYTYRGNVFDAHKPLPEPKPQPRRPPIAACGTRSGYIRHRNTKETPCEECRAANAAYGIQYRKTYARKSRANAGR